MLIVTVGVIEGTYWRAPRSGGLLRAAPLWSVVMGVSVPGKTAVMPAPIAGLPACRAMVWVGPPLSAKPASLGSPPMMSEPVRPVPSGLLVTRSLELEERFGTVPPLEVAATKSLTLESPD